MKPPHFTPRFGQVYRFHQTGDLRINAITDDPKAPDRFRDILTRKEKGKPDTNHLAIILQTEPDEPGAGDIFGVTNPDAGEIMATLADEQGAAVAAGNSQKGLLGPPVRISEILHKMLAEEKRTGKLPRGFTAIIDMLQQTFPKEAQQAFSAFIQRKDLPVEDLTVEWTRDPGTGELTHTLHDVIDVKPLAPAPASALPELHAADSMEPWQRDEMESLRVNTQSSYFPPKWIEPDPLAGALHVVKPVTADTASQAGYGIAAKPVPKLSASTIAVADSDKDIESLAPVYDIEQAQGGTLHPEKSRRARYAPKNVSGLSLKHTVSKALAALSQTAAGKVLNKAINIDALVASMNLTRTSLSMSYPVPWTSEKIIRDIYQNFLDAHQLNGHGTLEGVRFKIFKRTAEGPYVLRIEAQGEYPHESAVLIGHSSKTGQLDKAGGFGEGMKIVALKLLKDHGVERLTYSSRNWQATYSQGPYNAQASADGDEETPVVHIDSKGVADRPGNFMEIEARDLGILQKVLDGSRLCFYPQNGHFATQYPGVETPQGGFQFVGMTGRGNVYLNGQRYEYQDQYKEEKHWDGGLEFINLWLHKKLEGNRDRPEVDLYELSKFMREFVKSMTPQQLVQGIYALEPLWDEDMVKNAIVPLYDYTLTEDELKYGGNLAEKLLGMMLESAQERKVKIDFRGRKVLALPSMYDDTPPVPGQVMRALQEEGYEFVPESFASLGARKVGQYWAVASQKTGQKPTQQEVFRINILKNAALGMAGQTLARNKNTFAFLRSLYDREKYSDYFITREMEHGFRVLSEGDFRTFPIYLYDHEKGPLSEEDHKEGLQLKTHLDYTRRDERGRPAQSHYILVERGYLQRARFEEVISQFVNRMLTAKYRYRADDAMSFVLPDALKTFLHDMMREQGSLAYFHKKLWTEKAS